jgi:hypothetical protein
MRNLDLMLFMKSCMREYETYQARWIHIDPPNTSFKETVKKDK